MGVTTSLCYSDCEQVPRLNMSASRTKTVRLSHDLFDACALRAKELGYPSVTALIEALIRYDCLTRSKHGVTINWSRLPPLDQDSLDSRLLGRTLRKEGMTAAQAATVDWRTL